MTQHRFFARTRTRKAVIVTAGIVTATLLLAALPGIPAEAASNLLLTKIKPVPGASASPVNAAKQSDSSTSALVPTLKTQPATSYSVQLPTTPSAETRTAQRGTAAKTSVVAGEWKNLGSSGIRVAPAASKNTTAGTRTASLSIVSKAAAKKMGLHGLVLKAQWVGKNTTTGALAVSIPTAQLAATYGADYAARTRWTQTTVTSTTLTAAPTSVPSTVNTAAKTVVLTPKIGRSAVILAATTTSTSSTGTGSFAATPLKAAGTWDVSAQTGDFSWQYPLTTPPAAAGPAPDLSLSYDSQTIDGETGATNNQPSAVGEGWDLGGAGFIERSYTSCSQDDGASGAVKTSGDQCWKSDNATINLGSHTGQLLKDTATGTWKLQHDDGSRIEHLVGTGSGCAANGTHDTDCWRLTTTDGTQYYFGLNELPGWASGNPTTNSTWTVPVFGNDAGEPCHASTFAASSCTQAWRWNLDYVVDTHKNAEAFYYDAETNKYAKNNGTPVSYTRGGQLNHIDYGLTSSTVYTANAASDKVVFGYDAYGRCSDSTHTNCTTETMSAAATMPAHPASYPDVPFDQYCTASTCTDKQSPTFFTDGMLDTITTEYRSGTTYPKVDVWSLGHSFPAPGDGTNAALWLSKLAHTGYSGSTAQSEPATTFTGLAMQNRVWAVDGLAPLDKYRISSIKNSMGGVTSVNYSKQDCTPAEASSIEAAAATNTRRCFPEWWTPQVVPAQEMQLDLFHKYVVTSVIGNPVTGGGGDATQETDYVYTGTPGWRYQTSTLIPAKRRTWSDYAGYDQVEVRVGDSNTPSKQKTTQYTFYRGMDGDRASTSGGSKAVSVTNSPGVDDSLWFAGEVRDEKVLNGVGGNLISDTVTTPWASAVKASDGILTSRMVDDSSVVETQPLASGGNRRSETDTAHDATYGLPTQVETTASDAASSCTRISYVAPNTTAWIIGLTQDSAKVGVACDSTPSYPRDAILDVKTGYNTQGDPTSTQTVDDYPSGTAASAHWVTSNTTTYDTLGRPLVVTDVAGHTTTNSYTPATGGPLTGSKVVNTAPFNWATTNVIDPSRGTTTSQTSPNNRVTSTVYDPLGRLISGWLPDRPKSSNASSPSVSYAYVESQTGPSSVATTALTASGTTTSYALYDGLGQEVQTQEPAESGGTTVGDSEYDSLGQTVAVNNPYWTTSVDPSGALFVPENLTQIPSRILSSYDGAGRSVSTITDSYGKERFRTTMAYLGMDRIDTTPPAGGTPTTSISNSLGQNTSLTQYLAATPDANATTEKTAYSYDAQGHMVSMTDPSGNKWTWGFDVLGHQTTATDPDTGTSTATWDATGNQLTSKDARGVTLAYSYDALNRKTGEYSGSTSGNLLDSWSYDTLAKGQLTSSSSYTGSTPGHPGAAYTSTITGYDAANRPAGETVSIPSTAPAFGGTSYTVGSFYNQDGSLSVQTDPAEGGLPAERLRYAYDGLGNVSAVAGTSALIGASYTPIGQLSLMTRSNTSKEYSSYGYDVATGLTSEIKDQTGTGADTIVQSDRVYTHDNAGDVTSSTNTQPTVTDTQCYSYDALQELTNAWTPSTAGCASAPNASTLGGPAPYWKSFTFDAATGNRLTSTSHSVGGGTDTVSTYSYPAAKADNPHAVQTVSTTSSTGTAIENYGYNEDGATTTRPGQTLTYDDEGKISTVSADGSTQSNIYDANGTLLLQVDPKTGSTLFLGDTELHQSTGTATTTATRTYTLASTIVAENITTTADNSEKLFWLNTDIDGTADLEVADANGAITHRYTDPYGNKRGAGGTWSDTHTFLNQATSTFSGLVQLGARAYDSVLGKFLSVDPTLAPENPLQNNGYSYSASNPVTNTDVTGQCYIGASDSLNGHINCGGGHGITAPQAPKPSGGAHHHHTPAAPSGPVIYVSGVPVVAYSTAPAKIDRKQRAADLQNAVMQEWAWQHEPAWMPGWMVSVARWQNKHNDSMQALGAIVIAGTGDSGEGATARATVSQDMAVAMDAPTAKAAAQKFDELVCAAQSFTPETQVVLASGGTAAISSLHVGDKVLARDTKSGKTRAQVVTHVWDNRDTDLLDVTVAHGGTTSVIHSTQHHPFWDATAKKWVEAQHLASGTHLLGAGERAVTVAEVTVVPGAADMWDLTVATDHDFSVSLGDTSVLVHNCGAEKTYQTYTKTNQETGQVYSGRTSGTGSARDNVAKRDSSHSYTEQGYGPAELDQSSSSYSAIRGREQQNIDAYRAQGLAGNKINGISPSNPKGPGYMQSAIDEFGQ